jgi:hypothetical protein
VGAVKIKPYFVVGWTINCALRVLAGHGVLVSYALVEEGRVTLDMLRAFVAAGCELVFDNGEFSRWKSGRPTNGPAFYAWLRSLDAAGIPWRWAVALDVIGDAEGTRTEWRRVLSDERDLLLKLVPVFHEGDPWDLLDEYEPDTRLVGLGRTEGRKSKAATFGWYDGAFNRYPDLRAHALGNATPETLEPYPFESFDASSWERNAAYSNAHGWPFNRCSKELRQRAYVEAAETLEYRPSKQLGLRLIQEVA